MVRGHRRHQGANQHLAETRRHRKDHGARHQSPIGILGCQMGHQRIHQQTHGGEQRHHPDGEPDIKPSREKGEDQIYAHLHAEIHHHQRAQQRKGHSVQPMKGGKQHSRHHKHRRHGQIRKITGKPRTAAIRNRHVRHLSQHPHTVIITQVFTIDKPFPSLDFAVCRWYNMGHNWGGMAFLLYPNYSSRR